MSRLSPIQANLYEIYLPTIAPVTIIMTPLTSWGIENAKRIVAVSTLGNASIKLITFCESYGEAPQNRNTQNIAIN